MTSGFDWLEVESLDLDAQGIAHRPQPLGDSGEPVDAGAGKVVFIEGALPGERVQVQIARKKNNWEQGQMSALSRESSQRVRPGCPHFGLHTGACGGCKMQHLHPAAQVAVKQRVLEDNLWHLAKVKAERLLRPIEGPAWGYRDRARLSVRYVHKKGTVLVGFHERKSRYVADMQVCPVLPAKVSALLMPLRVLIGSMELREQMPQIELAAGEGDEGPVTALVLRNLAPLTSGDAQRLREFAAVHEVQWWLQPKGPDTVHLLDEGGPVLSYRLPEFGITVPFKPTDFTQVNPQINRVLVDRALKLLDVQATDHVIDWFCGLGNFTLPLATRAAEVLGIEGSETLVARARDNARLNGLAHKTRFEARNIFEITPTDLRALGPAQRWLIDPPREGAFALAKAVVDLNAEGDFALPRRMVYVSCNPATLARDAGLLVHQGGYRCSLAGVVNMFPHTAHVESMAVFDRV